jgi:hypothetical protein
MVKRVDFKCPLRRGREHERCLRITEVVLFANDRALRAVVVQLGSWVAHGRVHVDQGGTDGEFTMVVSVGSQVDSTLKPKEGKWHQPRRRP